MKMKLYKFRSLHDENNEKLPKLRQRILDIIKRKQLYCEKWKDFKDRCEGAYLSFEGLTGEMMKLLSSLDGKERDKKIEELGLLKKSAHDRLRVCSLTMGPLCSDDLWRVHGDCGRGVAIEFETDWERFRHPFYKVDYPREEESGIRNVFGVLNSVGGNLDRISESLLTWKKQEYDFENEVRIICGQSELEPVRIESVDVSRLDEAVYRYEKMENGDNRYFNFANVLQVKKVWCGSKMDQVDFDWVKSNIVEVPVVRLDEKSGSVVVK